MENKRTQRNIISSIVLQLITIISGFIVPRVIIQTFGSETNGLISSLSQFLNYVALLEGGISGVIMASLYKPLSEHNDEAVSSIIVAAQRFFRQIGIIYIVYVIILAMVYPLFVKTSLSYSYVLLLCIVLGSNLFVQYFFSLAYRLLLNADQKVYIVSWTQTITVLLNMCIILVAVNVFDDVLAARTIGALVFIIQPLIYGIYVKKHYKLDKKIAPNATALNQRWDGFGQNIAFFIHTNTDIVILTFCSTLEMVSVYSIYFSLVSAIKNVVIAVSSAIVPTMGNVLVSNDRKRALSRFRLYEFGIGFLSTLLFSCCLVLIVPFVKIYTSGIADVNYDQSVFAFIITFAEMLHCFRDPYVSLAYTAGRFKQTAKYAYIEAGINIIISVVCVSYFGIVGIALGTMIAMAYRMVAHVIYLRHHILYRNIGPFIKNILCFGCVTAIIYTASQIVLGDRMFTLFSWFIMAAIVFLVTLGLLLIVSVLFYRDIIIEFVNKVRKE